RLRSLRLLLREDRPVEDKEPGFHGRAFCCPNRAVAAFIVSQLSRKIGSRAVISLAEYREYPIRGNPELCFLNTGRSFSPTNARASRDRKSSPGCLGGNARRSS